MKIHVKIFATLRLKIGLASLDIETNSVITILQLLKMISRQVNYDVIPELIENNEVRVGTIILIDGKNILHAQKLDTKIEKICKVEIFPPVGGG